MLGRKFSSRKNLLIEDVISVEDILLEYIINKGWKDYKKFARMLTETIAAEQPSTRENLSAVISGFGHPFFTFNEITKRQFVEDFPFDELLWQSRMPRQPSVLAKQRPITKRKAISRKIRFLIMERDGFRCCTCGKNAKETKLEVDHKIPVAKGGTDSLDNMWTLCFDCNRGKSDLSARITESGD